MANKYTEAELEAAHRILFNLQQNDISQGIERLRILKDDIYASIPDNYRASRGITWVLVRISKLFIDACRNERQVYKTGSILSDHLESDDRLVGVSIFLMSEYGIHHPLDVLDYFLSAGDSENWEVCEFAAGGLQKIIKSNKSPLFSWLQETASSERPNLRRMVSESLRPVAADRWLFEEPQYSLGVLELVCSEDKNSYWIAYRACRNLVKEQPKAVMDALGVDEYRYKKLQYFRNQVPKKT